jgi:ClpP class serine protease
MDTPGGDVAGCFDCVKSLRALADSSEKPLWAIASDMYCSAGMALASAADKRLITSTAVVGSIGVLMAHANYEKQLEENGIDVTLIHAGAHKVDGNPYQALSEDVYNEFLANTESLRQEFAELVAQNMNLSVEKVLATEARTYRGEEAIQIGLADQLVNSNEAIQIFSEYLSTQGSTTFTGASMSQDATKAPKQDDPAATDPATDTGAQAQDTSTDLRAEERARIGAIIGSEEAKGREGLANHLATNTDLSVEAALGVLSAAATEQQATNNLDGVMSEQSPSIGADTSADDDQTQEQKDANAIAGSFKKIKGN